MTTLIVIGVWFVTALAVCVGNYRWHRIQPDPDPWLPPTLLPLADEEGTRRIGVLPPVPQTPKPLPERMDLVGYELDAKFFAVVAPSFREYR